MTDRSAFTEGLRRLADILDTTPDLPLPYHGNTAELLWIASNRDDHKAVARIFTRAIPGTIAKEPRGDAMDLTGEIAGLHVSLIVDRDQVCERVVVGTETVTLPAEPAKPAEPERVVEREVVEWRCEPLLAEVAS